ncbi:hypothetical protein [Salipaludibacillus daqingensis]|uniref:hypothetical protein n=1 Tax=Salipaludibacillus daqingensis TaxID=3041001 RepID=UPI0024772BE8|nr:hypothetical protein [Salipaludibacillus daqingensis]
MFVRYLPKSFWLSLIVFVSLQWLAIPIVAYLTTSARDVMAGILIIIGVIYPIYFISTIIYLRKVKNLCADQLIIAGFFLLIPLLAYIPIFA